MTAEKKLVIVQTLSHVFLGEEDPQQDMPTVLHNAICATVQQIERDGAYGMAINAIPFGLAMDRMEVLRLNSDHLIAWAYVDDMSKSDQLTVMDFIDRLDKLDDAKRAEAAGIIPARKLPSAATMDKILSGARGR